LHRFYRLLCPFGNLDVFDSETKTIDSLCLSAFFAEKDK
jgi:hypothetical protein